MIGLSSWDTVLSRHELSTIKHVVLLKEIGHTTPLPPHNGHFLLSPRWPLCRGSTVNKIIAQKKTHTSKLKGNNLPRLIYPQGLM